jgi:hypothetical protein
MEKQINERVKNNLAIQIQSLIEQFESAIKKINERGSEKNEVREKEEKE